jgi:SAM-dependent methyltransferase
MSPHNAPMSRHYARLGNILVYMSHERLWNANIHYHSVLLNAIPNAAQRVLDVGCGDGILSGQLLQAGVRHVVALDADAGVLARARALHPGAPIEWRCGDIFDLHPITHESFDAVLSVATLHHMDAAAGLTRFAELVRPGGVVGIIGLAANSWWDLPYAAIGHCARVAVSMTRGHWEHSAPIAWPPPMTYREIKRIAPDILPGVQYRHHLYGRYSLVWTKPGGAQHL